MDLKTFLSLAAIALCPFHKVFAQDILIKSNGKTEEVKLIEIAPSKITYKKWDNPNGPTYSILRRQVKSITYANGEEENFTTEKKKIRKDKAPVDYEYGRNSIVFYPASVTNTSAIGIGFAYERMFGKRYLFSANLPVTYSFDNPYSTQRKATMLWINPGARFYPTGNAGIVRFGLGPSLFFGAGHQQYNTEYYDYATGTYRYYEVNDAVFTMGLMANFSLNLQPSKKWIAGLDFGIGVPFFVDDGLPKSSNGSYSDYIYDQDNPIFNFQVKIGYRF